VCVCVCVCVCMFTNIKSYSTPYISPVVDVYVCVGKGIHLMNSVTGMNQHKIVVIIIIITVILQQLHLAHYLII
jgi:hypothetical protein